jgi:hypothetical protein
MVFWDGKRGMNKTVSLLILTLLSTAIPALDINYNWSLGEFGFAYSNANNKANFDFNALEFNWIESFTGLGIGFKLFDARMENDNGGSGYYVALFPFEAQWTPFVYKTKGNGYINLGIYDRLGIGAGWDYHPTHLYSNIIGLRILFSTIAMGRYEENGEGNYSYHKSLFLEYNTTSKSFRIGFKIDYLILTYLGIAALFMNDWRFNKDEE